MQKEKRAKNKEIAKAVKKMQREKSPNSSSNSLQLILNIKRFRDADIPLSDIAKLVGKAEGTVKKICSQLNKVELTSPEMKELAVAASKDILKNKDDNPSRIKIIDRVFPKQEQQRGGTVNINLKPLTTDFSNTEYDYVDMENY